MVKSPVKDIDVGIPPNDWSDSTIKKYRDVRHKATNEYRERVQKVRTKKDKTVVLPKYKPGDEVVLGGGFKARHYHLVEVIDFENSTFNDRYFALLKRTTDKELQNRIGRLVTFHEKGSFLSLGSPIDVPKEKIKWFTT
jgi:hypothetical protein